MNELDQLPEATSNEEPYLTVALDGYIDGLYEADMALESIGDLCVMMKESPNMTKRELRFVRLTLECWQQHLNMPEEFRLSMEDSGDEQSDAIQEGDGFFLKIWKAIKITFNWIINAIKGMFSGDNEKNDKKTDDHIKAAAKNANETAEVLEEKGKKAGEDGLILRSLVVMGVKGESIHLGLVTKRALELAKNIPIVEEIPQTALLLFDVLKENVGKFETGNKKAIIAELKKDINKSVASLESIFSKYPKASKEQAESMGTDEGVCYAIPIFPETVNVIIKVIGGDTPKITTKLHRVSVDGAASKIDPKSFTKAELHKYMLAAASLVEDTEVVRGKIKLFNKALDTGGKEFLKRADNVKATDPKVDNEFAKCVRQGALLMASVTVLLKTVSHAYRQSLRVFDTVLSI